MGKILIIILVSVSCCMNQKRNEPQTTQDKFTNMKDTIFIPEVSSDFEKLNLDNLPHDSVGKLISKFFDDYYLEVEESPKIISIREIRYDSYFTIINGYNNSGNIVHKGVVFTSGSWESGKWYFFDESGNLSETINYDEPFKFSFGDLFELLNEKEIPLTIGYLDEYAFHTRIRRYISESGVPLWTVKWEITYTLKKLMTINGITGEVMKIEEIKYSP